LIQSFGRNGRGSFCQATSQAAADDLAKEKVQLSDIVIKTVLFFISFYSLKSIMAYR